MKGNPLKDRRQVKDHPGNSTEIGPIRSLEFNSSDLSNIIERAHGELFCTMTAAMTSSCSKIVRARIRFHVYGDSISTSCEVYSWGVELWFTRSGGKHNYQLAYRQARPGRYSFH